MSSLWVLNGTILHYNGSNWSSMTSGTTTILWCLGQFVHRCLRCGRSGTILHYNGSTWSAMTSGTTNYLRCLGQFRQDVFAVGDAGTILHYNGSTWRAMSSGTTNNLQSVWGSSSSVVFTVGLAGISGTILQYLGYYSTTGWDAVTGLGTPNVSNLLAITPVVTPTIGYSPASLTFTATQGGANPANQTLNIQNTGGGTLSWSIGDNAAWLGLNPTSGSSTGQQNPATASVNISGMTAGTYNATITITASGATNTPRTVPVTLTINPPSTIGYSPASLTFTATQGGANPANQTLNIQNTGGGTLSWSIGDNASWLGLSPTSGSSTGLQNPVTVSVNISGMTAGTYNATITITASGATNTPRTVPVTLTISPLSPTIGYSPASLTFTATQGGANPANQTLNIQNTGGGTLSWSLSGNAILARPESYQRQLYRPAEPGDSLGQHLGYDRRHLQCHHNHHCLGGHQYPADSAGDADHQPNCYRQDAC